MIKLTINELLEIAPILKELSGQTFKGVITFKIARLIREIDKEITLFEEAKNKLIDLYGEKDENGTIVTLENGLIKIKEAEIQKCNEELVALLETTVEINAEKISIEAFDNIEISPAQALIIDILVDY